MSRTTSWACASVQNTPLMSEMGLYTARVIKRHQESIEQFSLHPQNRTSAHEFMSTRPKSDSVLRWSLAISFKPSQNGSSRLTLVLCPASIIERFTTVDFMALSSSAAGLLGWGL